MARRLTSRPTPPWIGDLPVVERILDNGLKALVLPRPDAAAVVCDLFYPIGSVEEPPGKSGLAHFLEHMLFKGTDRFPKGRIDLLAFVAGGQANAETTEDCTHYWFAFPQDRWKPALEIEADRMRNARFDPIEVEAERSVILEERARELESPLSRLDQTHLTMTYLAHPYRNPILGWPDDLLSIGSEDLIDFHARHYHPDGAVFVVVGATPGEKTLDEIERAFRKIRARPKKFVERRRVSPEPPQNGRRDFTLWEADSLSRGLYGWSAAPRRHPDGPALDVLSDLLSCGRRSRLWRRLVEESRLATWVEAAQDASRHAGQFLIQVEAARGIDPRRIEDEIRGVLDAIASQGPSEAELARSRRRLEAAWRWEQEDLAGLASGLGQVALWDDWRAWQNEHKAALAVDADAIRRVTSTYLNDQRLTAGWSLPRPKRMVAVLPASREPEPPAPQVGRPLAPIDRREIVVSPPPKLGMYQPREFVLPNGLRLLTDRRPGTGVAAIEVYLDAGVLREEKPGLAHLTGRLREEGTNARNGDELAEAIEDVGGVLEVYATGLSLRTRTEDLALAVDMTAELLVEPRFPREALPWMKERIAAELQGDRDDPGFRAEALFRSLVFGDHPLGRDPRGSIKQLAAIEYEDVLAHNSRFFRPDRAIVAVAGDFDPQTLRASLARGLSAWQPSGAILPAPEGPEGFARPRRKRVVADGEQVHIFIGHLGVSRAEQDYDALTILDHILGSGPGFTDRLGRVLRDELGLAYAVSGGMTDSADVVRGLFRVSLGTNPDLAAQASIAAIEQIRSVARGEFSDDEVDAAKRYLTGAWVFEYQTVGQRAERLLELGRWGLPLDDPITRPARIASIEPDQVRAAARKHLRPDSLIQLEYGPLRGAKNRSECA